MSVMKILGITVMNFKNGISLKDTHHSTLYPIKIVWLITNHKLSPLCGFNSHK